MSVIDDLIVRIKRGDSAATRTARDAYRWLMRANLPETPTTRALFSALFRAHDAYVATREYAEAKLLVEPMVRARFHHVGKGVSISGLPYVRGHARISIGDGCRIGSIAIQSGRFVDEPELTIGNDTVIASNVVILVNQRITIGASCGIAGRAWISDSDNHPSSLEARARGEEISVEDIKPITIEDLAWIGHGAHVLKGVTVGRGAVVAAGSTVIADVPAGALAMGVPARIVKNW